jgi:hypothetical protein
MNHIAIISPFGLSKGIVESQIAGVQELFARQYGKCDIWCDPDGQFVPGSLVYKNIWHFELSGYDALYTRSCLDFFRLFLRTRFISKKPLLIYDFRGLVFEESKLRHGPGLRSCLIKLLERFAYENADIVHCVSNRFKRYLQQNWGDRAMIKVYPCCVHEAVLKTSVPKRPWRFVYAGGVAAWQNLDQILDYHRRLVTVLPDTELRIYTSDRAAMLGMVERHGIRASVETVPHDQIAGRMAECDFGYLFRDDIVLNQVASPVKFLEYVSNGVIPVITEGVGDYSEDIKKFDLGVLASPDGSHLEEDLSRMQELLRVETYDRLFRYSSGFLWRYQKI